MRAQDEILGKGKTLANESVMRLPIRCLMDFSLGGGLCHVFAFLFKLKSEGRLKNFEFKISEDISREEMIEIVKEMSESLINEKVMVLPSVFIRPDMQNEEQEKICEISKRRGFKIVEDEHDATHIIMNDVQDEIAGDAYASPYYKRNKHVMMHWLYLPPSYDSWIQMNVNLPVRILSRVFSNLRSNLRSSSRFSTHRFQAGVTSDMSSSEDIFDELGMHRVSASWLFDSDKFNEYMDEFDYKVNSEGKKQTHNHVMMVDDLMDIETVDEVKEKVNFEADARAELEIVQTKKHSRALATTEKAMPTTNCDICGTSVTVKGLGRHKKAKHGPKKYKCDSCSYKATREDSLQSHIWRIHLAPIKKGRPKKRSIPKAKREPFRMKVVKEQFGHVIGEREKLKNEFEQERAKLKKEIEEKQAKYEQDKRKYEELEIRLRIMEKKKPIEKAESLPNLKDIPAVLKFFGLSEGDSIGTIRETINIKILEVSPESMVLGAGVDDWTEEEQEKRVMFLNQAMEALMDWKDSK